MFHIFQMNDGNWWIAAMGGRPSWQETEDNMRIWRAGIDKPYPTRSAAETALQDFRDRDAVSENRDPLS